MLFNSIDFAVFLPITFFLYWFITNRDLKLQNGFIVLASYFFYGWWDWRFLSLIIFSTVVDYAVGLQLSKQQNQSRRKWLLWTSILVNLGLLGFFKYFNFFLDNFIQAFSFFGSEIEGTSLHIILPVGISFYTFQTLSYTIDIYKKKLEPTRDVIAFAAFVSFFPQLVAGPIERAKNLLPQFVAKRSFDYNRAVDGMRQILWGLFKKVVIADSCAGYVNDLFDHSGDYSGSTLLLGAFFFAFQIYGDFSGYSDIAIGTARLFGFNLMQNFAFPYFSRDMAEFWRRWHISLSTWFRDYLYIPLGGSRVGTARKVRNIFIIFMVSGFWHGANWTFLAWGALNAVFFLPLVLTDKNRENLRIVAQGKVFPSFRESASMLTTFGLVTLAWVFFRADSMVHAISYLREIFSPSLLSIPAFPDPWGAIGVLLLISLLVLVEWLGREHPHALAAIEQALPKPLRWLTYYVLSMMVLLFSGQEQAFIYFQF